MKNKISKALLINTIDKTVSPVEVSNLHDIYEVMGVELIQVATYLPNGDVVFVDEEGLYNSNRSWFTIEGGHQPFIGNALVIGTNHKTGENADALSTKEEIEEAVTFLNQNQVVAMVGGY